MKNTFESLINRRSVSFIYKQFAVVGTADHCVKKKTESRSKTAAGTIVNRHKSQIQRDIADTCIYSRRLYTKTYSLLKIGGSC